MNEGIEFNDSISLSLLRDKEIELQALLEENRRLRELVQVDRLAELEKENFLLAIKLDRTQSHLDDLITAINMVCDMEQIKFLSDVYFAKPKLKS